MKKKKELMLGLGLTSALVGTGLATTVHADDISNSLPITGSETSTSTAANQTVTSQDLSEAQARVTTSEKHLNTEKETLTNKEADLATKKQDLANLLKQEEALQADKTITPDTLSQKQKEVAELEGKEADTTAKVAEGQQKSNEATSKQEKAQKAVAEASTATSQTEQELTQAQKKLEEAQKAFGSKAGDIDHLKQDINQKTATVKDLQNQKTQAEVELKKAQNNDKNLAETHKKLTSDKKEAENQLSNQNKERENVEKQLSPLEKRLNEINHELSTLTADTPVQIQPEDTSKYRKPEVATPSSGNLLVGLTGEFLTPDKQAILDELNRIRKEAYDNGIKYSDYNGVPRSIEKYVPLKWSKDLEEISLLRAAENSIYYEHTRLTGQPAVAPNVADAKAYPGSNVKPGAENLTVSPKTQPQSTIAYFQDAINDWYKEKAFRIQGDYSLNKTGHYNNIINPNNLYTSLSIFKNTSGKWPFSANQRFAKQFNIISNPVSESLVGHYGKTNRLIETPTSSVSDITLDNKTINVNLGQTSRLDLVGKLNFKNEDKKPTVFHHTISLFSGYTLTSDHPEIVTANADGSFTAKKAGTATVTATVGGQSITAEITVQAPSNTATEKLVTEQKQLQEKVQQLKVKRDTTEQSIGQLTATIQQLNEQLKVNTVTPLAQKKLDEVAANLEKVQKELQVLTEKLNTLTASDADKEAELQQAQKLVDTAKEKFETSKKVLTAAKEQEKTAKQEAETAQKELIDRKLELENLQKQIADGHKAITSMEAILKDPSLLAQKEQEVAEKIAQQKSTLQTLEAELKLQQERVTEATKALEEARRHYDQLKAQYDLEHTISPTQTPAPAQQQPPHQVKPAVHTTITVPIKDNAEHIKAMKVQATFTKNASSSTFSTIHHPTTSPVASYDIPVRVTNKDVASHSESRKQLPNTGTDSQTERKGALLGYSILALLGLAGFVKSRKQN